jgi:hypothetical protein
LNKVGPLLDRLYTRRWWCRSKAACGQKSKDQLISLRLLLAVNNSDSPSNLAKKTCNRYCTPKAINGALRAHLLGDFMNFRSIIAGLTLPFVLTSAFAATSENLSVPHDASDIPAVIEVNLFDTQRVVLRVPECMACGYHWEVTGRETDVVTHIKQRQEAPAPGLVEVKSAHPEFLLGGSTVLVIEFPKMSLGAHKFTLSYFAPGRDTAPLTRDVIVNVTAEADRWK